MNILSDNKSYPFEYSIKIFWKSLPWGNKIDLIRSEMKLNFSRALELYFVIT
jgi:hypothetical protein